MRLFTLQTILLTGASLVALDAPAADDAALAERKFCFSCHHATQAGLGPSFQSIAARCTTRRAQMAPVLAYKIQHGGGGNWGNVPMVPSQNVTPAEADALAHWVMEHGG
jgi:cytochrome c